MTLLAACAASSPVPVARTPDPSLLTECSIPSVSDPDTASDNDIASDYVNVAQALAECAVRHHNLIQFEKHK